MSEFLYTNCWFRSDIFEPYTSKFSTRRVTGIEIGCFEGRSTNWLVENWCKFEESKLLCIDPFTGSEEHTASDKNGLFERFKHNTRSNSHKLELIKKESVYALPELISSGLVVDFIYVDGDHHNLSVMIDAILSDRLLARGGHLIFDDYNWRLNLDTYDRPRDAIDYFCRINGDRYSVLISGANQLHLQKK